MDDPLSWHDIIPFISTLSLIVTSWLYWLLPASFTKFLHYQWNASSPRIHRQNRVTKSAAPFAAPPMSRALATWCIFVLGCCGNSPHLQAVHTHALSVGPQVSLFPKFRTQQAHTTLCDADTRLPNILDLWPFIDMPQHECMSSSDKNATYDGYRDFATRVG
jgi:hypothetical protein